MSSAKNTKKGPIKQESIFKLMLIMTYAVSAVFLIKNLISKTFQSAIIIGICLVVFGVAMFIMKKLKVSQLKKQLIVSLSLDLLVFVISLNSGAFYSDDFPLFLAVIALSGMYLEPLYTIIQTVLTTILFILLYIIHPEKADPMSQYIMCVGLFDVTAVIMCLLIKRGRDFITISENKATEANELIESITHVSQELENNYRTSSERLNSLNDVSNRLEETTSHLQRGSQEIIQGSLDVESTCNEVQKCVESTEAHISSLNEEVKKVEDALSNNKNDIHQMNVNMKSVKQTLDDTNSVFAQLQNHMREISEATEQLTAISASTKMLALNASIESARAGQAGAGFAVVATNVQDLAIDSSACSSKVVDVVEEMNSKIELTTETLTESIQAINKSFATLNALESGFEDLISQFKSLYENIEEQNENVSDVDKMFVQLKDKVVAMNSCSEDNQIAVSSIVEALENYKLQINDVIDDTKQIHELSSSMLEVSSNQ